jgi:hypothetical protein
VEHQRSGIQVGDHSLPQWVEDFDVLRLLPGQRVRGSAHGGHFAGRPIKGDRGGFLDDEALASNPDERTDRAEVDRDPFPQAHGGLVLRW